MIEQYKYGSFCESLYWWVMDILTESRRLPFSRKTVVFFKVFLEILCYNIYQFIRPICMEIQSVLDVRESDKLAGWNLFESLKV